MALIDLPTHVLLGVMQHLDMLSLCSAARTCSSLTKLAAHPSLHPQFRNDGVVLWDVRCTLAQVLKLPPQVFNVHLDVGRSRKFPITVPLHNLRPILNITDVEGLAEKVSKAVQACVERLSKALWKYSSWQELPPAASISICRADRGTVRASLRPEAVVPHILHQLQQLGWPPSSPAVPAEPSTCPDRGASLAAGCAAANVQDATAAEVMNSGIQLCYTRLELLKAKRQLHRAPGRARSPSSCEPRERLALTRRPATHTIAAAARHLPDSVTARQAADRQLDSLGYSNVPHPLSWAAVRLMYIRAAADPSSLTFSTPGKPGWLLVLQQSVKVLAHLHSMRMLAGIVNDCHFEHLNLSNSPQDTGSSDCLGSAALEMCWRAASGSELQMCLAGLLELYDLLQGSRAMSVAALYACVTALEAAAIEYAGTAWFQRLGSAVVAATTSVTTWLGMLKLSGQQGVSMYQGVLLTPLQQQSQLRLAVHQEATRVVCWGLWLLGVI